MFDVHLWAFYFWLLAWVYRWQAKRSRIPMIALTFCYTCAGAALYVSLSSLFP